MNKKIILFGGTFDPIHNGHIESARYTHQYLCADKTIFIPTPHSPFKKDKPMFSGEDRINMINLSISGCDYFEVSDIEFKFTGVRYSYYTIKYFKTLFGESADLYWLVGQDILDSLHLWYRVDEIFSLCKMIIVPRSEEDRDVVVPDNYKNFVIKIKNFDRVSISSSDIRDRLSRGRSITGLVHPAVSECISILRRLN